MEEIAIYGCGGFAREIAGYLYDKYFLTHGTLPPKNYIIFFTDLKHKLNTQINGIEIFSYDDMLRYHAHRKVIISFADPQLRKDLFYKCSSDGLQFTSFQASIFKKSDSVSIDLGHVFCEYTLCTANIKIGKFFQCNIYSYVGHDCTIGDFVTFAPRVSCNGNVIIQNGVYVGTGAVIRQGTEDQPLIIGENAIIGMGAVVTKSVEPNTVVYGNPAKIQKRLVAES